MKRFVIVLFVSLFFIACNNITSQDKYQITTSAEGNIYRLDKSSGEMWLIKGQSMEKVQAKEFRLKIGQRYVGEDVYSFTYLGKGQLGEVKTLDDFWKNKNK